MVIYDKLYIGGQWTPAGGSSFIEVINASTEGIMGRVPSGTREDVDRAVAVARAAFAEWGSTPVQSVRNICASFSRDLPRGVMRSHAP